MCRAMRIIVRMGSLHGLYTIAREVDDADQLRRHKVCYQITPRIYPYIPAPPPIAMGSGRRRPLFHNQRRWLSGKHGWLSLHRPLGFEFIDITPRDSSLNGYRF